MFSPKQGEDLIRQFKDRHYLTSGTQGLDRILGGNGFESQTVYELYGPEGAGKSTLLHQLICTASLPLKKGGLGAGSIYIDTEGTFSIRKVQQIASRFGIDPAEIARKVVRLTPPISKALVYVCKYLLDRVVGEVNARLFLLDSLATQFRAEYGTDPDTLPERQQNANQVIQALKRMAQITNGVAVLTNHETVDLSGYGKPKKHALGYIVGHASQVRITVQPTPDHPTARVFTIEKAPDLAQESCFLDITPKGFKDLNAKESSKDNE